MHCKRKQKVIDNLILYQNINKSEFFNIYYLRALFRLVESDIIISNSFESDSYLKPLPKNVSYTDEDFRHMSTDNVPCIHSSDQDDNSKEKDQTTLKKSKSTS